MTTAPTNPAPAPTPRRVLRGSLRWWGILLLVMFLLTSAVGTSLALESSYLPLTLASHIGLALVTLGIAGYAASMVGPLYQRLPRVLCGLAALSALGATLSGATFLLAGQSNGALYGMEGFAVLGILSSILVAIVGGESRRRQRVTGEVSPGP
jgi:4-amino-4-deoxy-L-arabinose transferase-like glycosyltransferase